MQRIFVFLSNLIIFCIVSSAIYGQKTKKTEMDLTPLFNGITIQGDISSVISSFISNGETYTYEASTQVDLKHKFFPVIEMGYGGANKTSNNAINFKTNGLYGRIGLDINLLTPKKDEKPTSNLFLAGVRLGMSSFPYSVSNAIVTDDYWVGSQSINYANQITTKIWYEIVAGVRVEITKNVFMGWTVRSRNLLSQNPTGEVSPWYIPGYGINADNNWGFNYVIGYKFQLPFAKKSVPLKINDSLKNNQKNQNTQPKN